MGKPTTSRVRRPLSPKLNHLDAIDTEPLTGTERRKIEEEILAMASKGHQAVLHWILRACAGKAECWVTDQWLAEKTGYCRRSIRRILREFEGTGETEYERNASAVIRCVIDRSLRAQRRIVVLLHPNAVKVLARFDALPCVHSGGTKTEEKPAEKVHSGGTNALGAGGTNDDALKLKRKANPEIPGFDFSPGGRKTPPAEKQRADFLAWIERNGEASNGNGEPC
jgi:hypothetical protein